MNIITIESRLQSFDLVKPYRIANKTIDSVANCLIKLTLDNGIVGLGTGAPIDFVTGETIDSCMQSLDQQDFSWLLNQSIYSLPALTKQLQARFKHSPAAAAAIDIALYDAYGQLCKLPLVDILGRSHEKLPTSITIVIKDLAAAITEASDYVAQGFKILKIKLGENLEHDLDIVHALRKEFPREIKIRVDMNEGYSPSDLRNFELKTQQLGIELIEQPFPKANFQALKPFSSQLKKSIAADESIISVEDAFDLAKEQVCGIFNIKLMKCGGITPALEIAKIADLANIDLMWGCMDESIISISAALHAAFACPNTKYLDLDGSFDLVKDIVQGGFVLEDGYLLTTDKPGLGITMPL